MKTNYLNFKNSARAAFIGFSFIMATSSLIAKAETIVKTTVFVDNFDRTDVTPGGIPEMTYTIASTATATAPSIDASVRLKLPSKASLQGDAFVGGGLAAYSTPFTAKLSECTSDSLVWTFNARQNYNARLTGFSRANTQNAVAIMLCADNADLTAANGYAIINAGDAAGPGDSKFSLAKVTGGLVSNANISWLATGQTVGNTNRSYMSIRVVYIPATNTWRLYEREDGTVSFMDPLDVSTLGYNLLGSAVDNTFTSTAMTSFGFTINYKSMSSALQLLVDNYQVTAYKTDTPSGLNKSNSDLPYSLSSLNKGFSINAINAQVNVYNTLGKQIIERNVNGSTNFTSLSKGVYLVKVQVNGLSYSSKFIVK